MSACAESPSDRAVAAYWQKPLTCRGPEFREPPPDPDSAPNEPRAIFRMSDQVVLAIPRHYLGGPWDENLPATVAACRSVRDLPQIQHLFIVIRGQWSGTFDARALPQDSNGDVYFPDHLHLHILPAWAAPKPTWNRDWINKQWLPATRSGPLTDTGGILCGKDGYCWFPLPGEADLYGSLRLLGRVSTKLNLTPILLDGLPYRGLQISGSVMVRDVLRTLPAVVLSVQEHLDRWNIVRTQEIDDQAGEKK